MQGQAAERVAGHCHWSEELTAQKAQQFVSAETRLSQGFLPSFPVACLLGPWLRRGLH